MTLNPRFWMPLNLAQYAETNSALPVAPVCNLTPRDPQMILRMLVESPYSRGLQLPQKLYWLRNHIEMARAFQETEIGVRHPFTYITVRHGPVKTSRDAAWHADGFSTRFNHLPEINYVFVFGDPTTEVAEMPFSFPTDFDPLRHNIHDFFTRRVQEASIVRLKAGTMYAIDPYVVHRRPPIVATSKWRTFVRIGFLPIEVPDINNTQNPLIPTPHYVTDGIKDFRDTLTLYDER